MATCGFQTERFSSAPLTPGFILTSAAQDRSAVDCRSLADKTQLDACSAPSPPSLVPRRFATRARTSAFSLSLSDQVERALSFPGAIRSCRAPRSSQALLSLSWAPRSTSLSFAQCSYNQPARGDSRFSIVRSCRRAKRRRKIKKVEWKRYTLGPASHAHPPESPLSLFFRFSSQPLPPAPRS